MGHTGPMRRACIAVLTLSMAMGACSERSSPTQGDIPLTLGRIIEEILPDEGATVRFEILRGGTVVFSDTYPVEFDGRDYRITLDTILLEALTYEVSATVNTTQATCSVGVDLSSEVALTVSALIRTDCFLEVEESEGWHERGGATLSSNVLEEFYGGGHCGWEEVQFIALGEYFVGDAYVRDPKGVFNPELFITSDARERLGLDREDVASSSQLGPDDYLTLDLDADRSSPPSATKPLGYVRGVRELFTSIDRDYLYVVSPDGVERWPRVLPHPACA